MSATETGASRSFPDLLVLRHGETEWNRVGRLQGDLDSDLTEAGRAQALRQGEILSQLGAADWDWYVSPKGRAMTTATLAGAPAGKLVSDPRLREIGTGDWTGRLRSELAEEHPQLFSRGSLGWYDHAPGGEGISAFGDRVEDFLRSLRAPAVIVTHGITSRVLRCLAMGRPASAFGEVEGGQGVVYRISNGQSLRLAAAMGTKPQS